MFKEEIIKNNLQGYLSSIINEIVEKCDAVSNVSFMIYLMEYIFKTLESVISQQFD